MRIIGRERELAAIRATVDRAPSAPCNLTLHGDPGVGKSVLLREAVAYGRERGMRVLGGTGYESEAEMAWAGLHQLFAPVPAYFDRVEPFHRDTLRRVMGFRDGPAPDRLAVSIASLSVLAAVAEDGPVLIAVEDAHWVDRPTREVVMFLILRLEPYDIRAVFARRPLTATERVSPGIGMLEVPPLDAEAAAELLAELHPGLPAAVRDRVLADAVGNPLAIAELPAAFGTDAADSLDLLPSGAPLRSRLETGYAGRALTLPSALRTALLRAALDGDGLESAADVRRPSGLTAHDIVAIERLGLIARDSTPSGLRFRHPLVRSAIIATASPDELRDAHTTLAEQYRREPERRMWHLAAAAVEPDEEVAAEIESAAESLCTRGGAGLAVTALRRAAALTPESGATARRLQRAAELASESGQMDAAQRLVDEARRTVDRPEHLTHGLTTRARVLLLRDGDLAAVRRLLDRAPAAGDATDRALQVRLVAAAYAQDPAEWERLRDLVKSADGARPGALTALMYDVLADLPTTASGLADRLGAHLADTAETAPPGYVAELCRAAAWIDQLHMCRPQFARLVEQETGRGALTYAAGGYWFKAHDHTLSGEWDEAEAAANAGLDLCVRHDLELPAQDLRCALGWVAAGRGDVDSARAYSRTVEQWAEPRGSRFHLVLSARNRALAELSQGDYEAAYEQCVHGGVPDSAAAPGYGPWMLLDLVEAAMRTGRVAEAAAQVAAADRAAVADRTPRLRLHMAAAHSLIDAAPAPEAAAARLRSALALPMVEQWPFDHARLRLLLGELHRRNHRPGDARPELQRAADIFRRIGATAWCRRAEHELRASGVAVHREPSDAPGQGAELLTPQQMEVAELAATGLSNKEIAERLYLSPRTVSAHLYRIFPKLGITSRSALRDALAERPGSPAR
ncbi:LuxR C-terminal-related transcriptional regulator [Embleya sp. NPDC059237]|uniref:LuxR C-terminal-related transcriptional regulator n=1 Tax=Embleya sp. NPDC059237 TaxID=3346784 RepID=UPI0036A2B014